MKKDFEKITNLMEIKEQALTLARQVLETSDDLSLISQAERLEELIINS